MFSIPSKYFKGWLQTIQKPIAVGAFAHFVAHYWFRPLTASLRLYCERVIRGETLTATIRFVFL